MSPWVDILILSVVLGDIVDMLGFIRSSCWNRTHLLLSDCRKRLGTNGLFEDA